MKKILFPFEINRTCYREAYVYAAKLSRNLGAELIMLHAFDLEVDNSITEKKYDLMIKSSWVRAYKEIILFHDYYLLDHARVDNELRIKVDHRIIHGELVSECKKILHDENINLVVLPATGDHETTNKKLKLMRREALETNLTSLLVTPCQKTIRQIDHILFVFEMKRFKGLAEYVDEIVLFANMYQASIHMVKLSKHERHSQDVDEEMGKEIQEMKSASSRITFNSINDRDPEKRLREYISENDIRLIAVSKHQLQSVGDLFSKSIYEEICMKVRIPLLVLKDSKPD